MESFPRAINKNGIKNIYDQLDNLLYKINEEDSELGIGFFCYLRIRRKKKIPVLIINNCQTSGKKYIKEINIFNNGINKKLQFGDTKYIDKKNNLMIFEVKPNRNDKFNFLEPDNLIFNSNSEMFYCKESMYIFQNDNKFKNVYVSFGTINTVDESHFLYNTNLSSLIKGLPILNLYNNKLIGIHESKCGHYYKGRFLKYAFKEFLNRYKVNEKNKLKKNFENEINIIVKVNKSDIGKKIYFLDNYENNGKEDSDNSLSLNHLKELTCTNTYIYINKEEKEFTNFFIPKKDGKYNINLKFDINI